MSTQSIYGLIAAITAASVSDDWESAVREWTVVGVVEDETCSRDCLCGHEHLRYLYRIRNELNGNEIFPIGCVCVRKIGDDGLKSGVSVHRQALDLAAQARALGRGRYLDIKDKRFSRKLIRYMTDLEIFPDNKYNGWNGDNDGRFLLDMFNRRGDMTERQRMKASTIIRNAVYPWLRKVWRDAHDQQDPGF